jgi:hypothetical protein
MAKTKSTSIGRAAFTFEEFAEMAGKHRSWTYRQVAKGDIKVISGYGAGMIPRSEVERIFGCVPEIVTCGNGGRA